MTDDLREALNHASAALADETSTEGRAALLIWFDRLLDLVNAR